MPETSCSWCATPLAPGEGFRAGDAVGARAAAFCRLEHVVPWALRGGRWASAPAIGVELEAAPAGCARCGRPVDATGIVLVRHRGPHRVADALCGVEHLVAWAKAGGRYGA